MVRVTLSNWGNGRAIRIPKQLREEAGLSDDERFEASVQADGSILLQPLRHDMRVIRVGIPPPDMSRSSGAHSSWSATMRSTGTAR